MEVHYRLLRYKQENGTDELVFSYRCRMVRPAGLLGYPQQVEQKAGFGIFQGKYAWQDPVDPLLIEHNWEEPRIRAVCNPPVQFRVNFPGIGNRSLQRSDVDCLLTQIPENVTVCLELRNSVKSHTKTEHAAQRQGKQAGADIVIQVCGMLRIGERSFRWLSP